MTKAFVVDTNILLDEPDVINKHRCIILSHVSRELEKHKLSGNNELAYKARNATRFIDNNIDKIYFDFKDYQVTFDPDCDEQYVDNKIIQACIDNDYGIITNDLLLKHKAKGYGIEILKLEENDDEYNGYGVKEVIMSDEDLAYFYENPSENTYGLLKNEYIILQNENGITVDKLKWDGSKHIKLNWKKLNGRFMGGVSPRNHRQELLFDLLQDPQTTIKACFGKQGTGKDYSMLTHAINLIENNKIEKIVFVRNNVELEDSEPIGFRKGELFDKLVEYAMPIADHIGGVEGLRMFVDKGQIELQHLGAMRGRDIKNSIIYLTESQNNTKNHMGMLIGRVGEGSQLWINGDMKQVDKQVFKHKSGIDALSRLSGNKLFGQVVLDEIERSETARLSELFQ